MYFRSLSKLLLILALFGTAPVATYAETVWLSDVLRVNIRSGPSNSNRIIQTIKSGTQMEVLEKPSTGDFWLVRTTSGVEGWIPYGYLTKSPTGSIRAFRLSNEKAELQKQFDALNEKYLALLADSGDVEGQIESLSTENEALSTELARIKSIAGNAIDLDAQYKILSEENARIKNELDVLTVENNVLAEYNDNKMIVAGGLLIVGGIILGIVLPRMGGKRKKEGWS